MYDISKIKTSTVDPKWKEISASLRDGNLFVKMPASTARELHALWDIMKSKLEPTDASKEVSKLMDLILDEAKGSLTYGNLSMCYMVSLDQCKKDIEAMKFELSKG